jgi:PST family polysaccharide transporter
VANLLHRLRARLRERHTLRAHAWQSLAFYTQQGFGLIFGIIMSRLLTPDDFGAFGFAAASVFLALLPATWSLAPTLVTDAGITPSLHRVAVGFAWCVVFVRLGIIAILSSWFFLHGQNQTAVLCLIAGFTESWRELNSVQRAYLEGKGNFKPNFISGVAGIAFCLGVVVPLAFLGCGPFTLALSGIGSIFIDFAIYRYFSGKSIFVKPVWNIGNHVFKKGFWLWLVSASEVALMRLDSWFLGKFRGDQVLGNYNRAFGYAPISHLVLSSLMSNPTVLGLSRCDTAAARLRLLRKTGAIVFAGAIMNWVIFYFFSKQIVPFVFGPKWNGAVPVFEAFASLSIAYAIAYLPITLMLAARRYRELAFVRVVSVALFACALFFVPGTRSATSVAWLVQATWLVQGLALLFPCRSILLDDSPRAIPQCTT